MGKQKNEEKWNDLVSMSERENEDGDYDAIIWAKNKIRDLQEYKDGAKIFITGLENRIRELETEVISLSFAKPKPIEFTEDDGTLRRLVWSNGDLSVGIHAGWEPDDDVSLQDMKDALKIACKWIVGTTDTHAAEEAMREINNILHPQT